MKQDLNKDCHNSINTSLKEFESPEKQKKHHNSVKTIFMITICIAAIIVLITICCMLYKNDFSIESLLSLLMAFFSIFISIFFYFKADETSNRFYDTSYNFMKDVSVTLGKIEERFGEKLNSLNEKISHLSFEKDEKSEELESAEDAKEETIKELLDKAQLSDNEKQLYLDKLKEQEKDIMVLQKQLHNIDAHYRRLQAMNQNNNNFFDIEALKKDFSERDLFFMKRIPFSDWPPSLNNKAIDAGILDDDGCITIKGRRIIRFLKNE